MVQSILSPFLLPSFLFLLLHRSIFLYIRNLDSRIVEPLDEKTVAVCADLKSFARRSKVSDRLKHMFLFGDLFPAACADANHFFIPSCCFLCVAGSAFCTPPAFQVRRRELVLVVSAVCQKRTVRPDRVSHLISSV